MTRGPGTPVRLFMVDDHPVVRQGLRLLLEQEGVTVCGEAGGIEEALRGIGDEAPDLVMVDLSLGRESGLELLRKLASREPGPRLMVYSMHEDPFHVAQAFASGASGYATKREVPAVLMEAIGEILAGRRYASPRVARVLDAIPEEERKPEPLSPQELQVYKLLGEGYSTVSIASELGVSRRTVDSYYGRILLKLGLAGMEELRRRAAARPPEK